MSLCVRSTLWEQGKLRGSRIFGAFHHWEWVKDFQHYVLEQYQSIKRVYICLFVLLESVHVTSPPHSLEGSWVLRLAVSLPPVSLWKRSLRHGCFPAYRVILPWTSCLSPIDTPWLNCEKGGHCLDGFTNSSLILRLNVHCKYTFSQQSFFLFFISIFQKSNYVSGLIL